MEPVRQDENNGAEIATYYLDEQGVLMMSGHFPGLYTDYYLHLMQHGIRYEGANDPLLKEALAAQTLHLASRPRDETNAWTWHFAEAEINLFVTGSNVTGEVTGRIFTENVRDEPHNLFFAQVARPQHEMRQSVISFEQNKAFGIVEEFYQQSQQQMGRFFDHGDERYSLVLAMPGADFDWITALNEEQASAIINETNTRLLEKRSIRFGCPCTLGRIINSLATLGTEASEELFDEDEVLEVTCPRCGAKYQATLEQLRELRPGDSNS